MQHIKEIKAKGFDTILLAVTEADVRFNLDTFKGFVIYAESQGLTVWATFWGLFAGESVVSQPTAEGKKLLIIQWLKAADKIGITNVMIDEPHNLSFVGYMLSLTNKINFHLCLADDTFDTLSDDYIKNITVKTVGVSCYHWTKDWDKIQRRTEQIATRLKHLRPTRNFIFLQAFDIPSGMEALPATVRDICQANGIKNFGVWSFRATEATSSKRPANPEAVWSNISFNDHVCQLKPITP